MKNINNIRQSRKHIDEENQKALLEIMKQDDLLSDVVIPSWLPLVVTKELDGYITFTKGLRNCMARLQFDIYILDVRYLRKVLPAFTDKTTKSTWDKLATLSEENTRILVSNLLMIENDFEGSVDLFYKHQNEINQANRVVSAIEKLLEEMEEYYRYFGHFLDKTWEPNEKRLTKMKHNINIAIKEFEKDHKFIDNYFCYHAPISRQYRAENAKPIFFARKLHLLFKECYNKPMHDDVAILVNAIFSTDYTANDIIKMVGPLKDLKAPEMTRNSPGT